MGEGMPRPWRITYSGAMYHVTSRGNGRQRIFFGDADCERMLEQLEEAVSRRFGVPVNDLHDHGHRAGVAKAAARDLCCRLTGKSQREVGACFGYHSESSVGKQRKLLAGLMREDRALTAKVAGIVDGLMVVKS